MFEAKACSYLKKRIIARFLDAKREVNSVDIFKLYDLI